MKLIFSLLIIIIGLCSTNSFSQVTVDSTESESTSVEKKYYLIIKNDGSEYYGYVLKDDGREVLIDTESIGKVFIKKSDIKEMRVVDPPSATNGDKAKLANGDDLRDAGPFTTRYYFTTNALPIKKKENYALIHLYGPEVHFALTDNLSLGVMATWIASPIALAAKYSFNNSNTESDINFAVGAIVGSGGYLAPQAFGGLYFGTVTKGNRSSNISLSAGFTHMNLGSDFSNYSGYKYQFQREDPSQKYYVSNDNYTNKEYEYLDYRSNINSVVLGISGIKSVGNKVSFIFDSMIFFSNRKKLVYNKETYLSFDDNSGPTPITNNLLVQEGSFINDGIKPTIIFMPGMRFSTKYGSAFQVVLSGIIFERSSYNNSREFIGIPIPTVSWLKAF